MFFLNRFLIYSYNDTVFSFIKGLSRFNDSAHFYGYAQGSLISGIKADYLSVIIWRILANFTPPVLLNNLLVILAIFLSLFFSYKLFKDILGKGSVSLLFSVFFSFSLYFMFRVISATYGLYFVFAFPLLIYLLHKKTKPVYVGFFIVFTLLLSSYYGYFALITTIFWYVPGLISSGWRSTLKNVSLTVIPVILAGSIIFGSAAVKNIPVLNNYTKVDRQDWDTTQVIYRPLEDFYSFSFRPWYFVIPPQSSLFFSDFSETLYDGIKDTGYFLADDYQEDEMGGVYMGWHFILGALVTAGILGIKKLSGRKFKIFESVYENENLIVRSFVIIMLILAITAPPTFTIGGIVLYTPSYLLYYLMPVFRVLVRFSVVIYLFILVINSFLFLSIYRYFKTKLILIFLMALVHFVVFAIPLPIVDIDNPPEEMAFLGQVSDERDAYTVFPSANYDSMFWILHHQKYLTNPPGFVDAETGVTDRELTKLLASEKGLQYLQKSGSRYLILYLNRISTSVIEGTRSSNPDIYSREDVTKFFGTKFGEPIYSKNGIMIYRIYD